MNYRSLSETRNFEKNLKANRGILRRKYAQLGHEGTRIKL